MSLGNLFTPGGTGFNPAIHKRPVPSPGYTLGTELAKVRTRPNLHQLDAALDHNVTAGDALKQHVENLLGKLTTAEQAELLRDVKPDGGKYSTSCRIASISVVLGLLVKWRISLVAQMNFLSSYIGENKAPWWDMDYSSLAPLIRASSQAERNKLHTSFWQDIFGMICTDETIVDAANDLGLQEPLRSKWIKQEEQWWPF
jgi:hypothetical protein